MNMKSPNAFKWSIKYGLISALTGMLCCVAPAVLFMFGLMGGVVAISFADFFYKEDGSLGTGSIILRIAAVGLGIYATYIFRKKQNQCSIDPRRKRKNLILLTATIVTIALSLYLSLEKWSAWYFDAHIVPAQKKELNIK